MSPAQRSKNLGKRYPLYDGRVTMSKPHYIKLAQQLTEEIAQGRYPRGSLLPTELQLCELFGTSRHTVRAALNELQLLGLVTRRKNVGTRVISTQARNGFQPTLASLDDLIQFGEEHTRTVQFTRMINASPSLSKVIGCATGSRWLQVSSLRTQKTATASLPIGWTDVYVKPEYADIEADVRAHQDVLVSTLIERRYGLRLAEIRQQISACTIESESVAQALQLAVGAPALKITREYLDAAHGVFEISVTIHPADRFAVSLRLTHAQG